MKKQKIKFVCSSCGYESLRWFGKCPECSGWNTMVEEIAEDKKNSRSASPSKDFSLYTLKHISADEKERYTTGLGEFDRVLGGGLVPGSVVLIGGDPGIGKSTLVLQAASGIAGKVMYISGEESLRQIKLRADRINVRSENIVLASETELNNILHAVQKEEPVVLIVDSIQTTYDSRLENSPGTVTQIRECTAGILDDAKKKGFAVLLIGHVTKEGYIAGPKLLEHVVDAVIQFEPETGGNYRVLRAIKNRFGSTNELGIFEMSENGLREVLNPSEVFLSERSGEVSGSVVTAAVEGTRPILIEVQALVTPSNFGNPQRISTGFDQRRLSILLAVLERRAGVRVSSHNVFLKIAGGVTIEEPAVDLAVCAAVWSSVTDQPVNKGILLLGEVGLGGEVRGINYADKRISEAEKLGFEKIVLPSKNYSAASSKSARLIPAESLSSALQTL
ncbi:MAG: DNA repair protein RadA [Ignavibacteriales bacterium]|nr:MAG: DNA repair protein RadA [Ignavibacteriales bacterium]